MPKRPVIENKMCDNHTAKLDMPCVGAGICACNHMPFMARPVVTRNQIPKNESITTETSSALILSKEWLIMIIFES